MTRLGATGGKKSLPLWGCGTLGLIAIGGATYFILHPNYFAETLGQETFPFNADTTHFDPFVALAEVRLKLGHDAHLGRIVVENVRSEGLMDLNAKYEPAPKVVYRFFYIADKPGTPLPANNHWIQQVDVECYQPGKLRYAIRPVNGRMQNYTFVNKGMDFNKLEPIVGLLPPELGPPHVSVADIWKTAVAHGANKDAAGTIYFDQKGYWFSTHMPDFSIQLDPTGKP